MPYAKSGAQSGDIELYYESYGEGPAIVFVHGGNGNTLSWFNQMPFFSRAYRCILVDLRSFKNSRCPVEHYHPKFFPQDMLAVLDHAGVERAGFVCQSLGAWAGLPLAVRHPGRVACLAISSSPTPAYSAQNWSVLDRSGAIAMAVQRGELPKAKAMGMSEDFMTAQPALTWLYEAFGRLNGPKNTALMKDEACRLQPQDFAGYLTPTLVTGGRHDNFLTPDHHVHVASLIPGARSHTFEHSGHSAYFEEPENYNEVIAEFFARHPWV